MDWRERYADKHISLQDAAARVNSGERVWFGMFTSNPESICRAIYERRGELQNLEVHHYVSPFHG
ncbi:MAG: hypothetical protein U5Q44_06470 [Dehalococcoidia bacterium]|nr:hypothetical protein [Dehalococcoidia bacterium]